MGVLIEMPVRNEVIHTATEAVEAKPVPAEVIEMKPAAQPANLTASIDFSVWINAPKERTAAYFPTYSAISRAHSNGDAAMGSRMVLR